VNLDGTRRRDLRTVLDVGAGADPAEILEQIDRRSACLRCGLAHELVALHGSGYGDSYVADCTWCLPMTYRPYRIAALRYEDGWQIDRQFVLRVPPTSVARFDHDESALTKDWAIRWCTMALPHLPDDTIPFGPLTDFDIPTAKAIVARHLRMLIEH
jgi:hypothetical protein